MAAGMAAIGMVTGRAAQSAADSMMPTGASKAKRSPPPVALLECRSSGSGTSGVLPAEDEATRLVDVAAPSSPRGSCGAPESEYDPSCAGSTAGSPPPLGAANAAMRSPTSLTQWHFVDNLAGNPSPDVRQASGQGLRGRAGYRVGVARAIFIGVANGSFLVTCPRILLFV